MGEKGFALEEEGCGQGRFPPSLLGLGWEGAKAKAGGSWGDEPRAGQCKLDPAGSGSASIQSHLDGHLLGQIQHVTSGAHLEEIQPPVRTCSQKSLQSRR